MPLGQAGGANGAVTTSALSALFALHLASILVLFLLMPFSKMVHGFFRLTALIVEAGQAERSK